MFDITYLLRAMDVANAEWKKKPSPDSDYIYEWAQQIAFVFRATNNIVGTQDMRGKVGLNALDEDMKGGAQEGYRRLKASGWVPQWLDSTSVARLPVRALVPLQVKYSGRKTSQQQVDSAFAAPAHTRASMGGKFALNANGDSIYVLRDGTAQDTIRPK